MSVLIDNIGDHAMIEVLRKEVKGLSLVKPLILYVAVSSFGAHLNFLNFQKITQAQCRQ